MNLDRVLSLVGEDAPGVAVVKLRAFRRFLLLAIAVESWESLHFWRTQPGETVHLALAALLSVCAVGAWWSRLERAATFGAAALIVLELVLAFPRSANHHYLEALLVGLICLCHRDEDRERDLALKSLRWLTAIGLFWAGLQKLLYGYYFRGAFLAYAISEQGRFATFFELLAPAAELGRLRATSFAAGAGPYLVEAPAFVVASNLTYLLELIPVALLLFRRTRGAAMWGLIAFVVLIELGARELFFGALTINLLLLFDRRDLVRRALPLFVVLYLYLLAMSLGLLPRWYFT